MIIDVRRAVRQVHLSDRRSCQVPADTHVDTSSTHRVPARRRRSSQGPTTVPVGTVARVLRRRRAAIAAARRAFDDGPWPAMRQGAQGDLTRWPTRWTRTGGARRPETATAARHHPSLHAEIPRARRTCGSFADYGRANEAYPDGELLSTRSTRRGVVSAISPGTPLMLAPGRSPPRWLRQHCVLKPPRPTHRGEVRRAGTGRPARRCAERVHGYGGEEVAGPLTQTEVDGSRSPAQRVGAKILAAPPNLTPVSAELGGKSGTSCSTTRPGRGGVDVAARDLRLATASVLSGSGVGAAGHPGRLRGRFARRPQAEDRDPKSRRLSRPLIEQRHLDSGTLRGAAQSEGGKIVTWEPADGRGYADGFYYRDGDTGRHSTKNGAGGDLRPGGDRAVLRHRGRGAGDPQRQARTGAGILFTRTGRAHRMAARWKAGTVWVNCYFERDLRLPFGVRDQWRRPGRRSVLPRLLHRTPRYPEIEAELPWCAGPGSWSAHQASPVSWPAGGDLTAGRPNRALQLRSDE